VTPALTDTALMIALAGALALGVGAAPLGVLLIGRRMSLVGDSLSHATLPGAAIAFLLAGTDPWALTLGALAAGLVVATASGLLSRVGRLPEDAAFAVLYLTALATGVLILGRTASVEIVHALLFGSVDALDRPGLILAAAGATATVVALALFGRGLSAAAEDGTFAHAGVKSATLQALLMGLVAFNLVAGFRAFGALMTVGLMMIPAASAGFWAKRFEGRAVAAVALSALSSASGLLAARTFDVEPGAAMVMAAAGLFAVSALAGRRGGLLPSLRAPSRLDG
jgi:zinc/manganese transport system permease protein